MKSKSEAVPDSLLLAIILHILIGWGFLYIVKIATVHLTHNAYLGLIPATIILLGFLWLIYDLARIFPRRGICEIYSLVFGKIAGKLIGVFFMLYVLFFTIIVFRDAQLMVYTYFFERTPFIFFTSIVVIIMFYIVLKGVFTIGRLASFMLLPPLSILILLIGFGLYNINIINVQPVWEGSPFNWLQTGIDLTLVLLPGIAVVFYLPFVKQPKSIKKIGLTSLGIVVPLFFLALFGTIGAFGPVLIEKMSWSIVEFFHIIDYPFLLLEQAGLFFLITWYPFVFIAVTQGFFLIGNELHSILPQIKRKWIIIAIIILVFSGTILPFNIVFLQTLLRRLQALIPLSFLGILLITWLVTRWRIRKGKDSMFSK